MSAVLEQSPADLSFLLGGEIVAIAPLKADGPYDMDRIALTVKTKVGVDDGEGRRGNRVVVEVWQDSEGNGPGYLALTDILPTKGAK